jgi:competence protein ComEC
MDAKQGMLISALSFLVGVSLVQQLTVLPDNLDLLCLFVLFAVCLLTWVLCWSKSYSWCLQSCVFVISGFLWAVLFAQSYLDHRLPEAIAGQDVIVEGVVTDIPASRNKVENFIFEVHRFSLADPSLDASAVALPAIPEKLRLSWYYGRHVHAGERWRFKLRLKPPHGFLNPGGFDYEAWLFQHGIHATGYVREDSENRKLSDPAIFSLDAVRHKLNARIQSTLAGRSHMGLVAALAVGNRSQVSKDHWRTLIKTGTNHLMAISGLHIGLAATFGYWLVRRLLPVKLIKRVSAQCPAVIGGLMVAAVYALLAGLSIPTQRALLMLVCFSGAWLLKRNFRPLQALATALLAILLWDPVSVLSAGFWFSFLAVSVIYYVFSGRQELHSLGAQSWGFNRVWKQWGWMQLSITLALFPASLIFFQQASLVSPLANLIMVPYVSFLVVPLILLSLFIMPVSVFLSDYLLIAANYLLELIWPLLNGLSEYKFSYWVASAPSLIEVVLATLGVVLLLAPRGFPARWLGTLLIFPALIGSPEKPTQGAFELNLLDVGQGLAAVIRTQKHVLLFDTGKRFSSRLDSGEAVIVPFLRSLSVNSLDMMVISHGDSDHIGGAISVLDAYPGTKIIGQDIEDLPTENSSNCAQGEQWLWDGVKFEFLHPDRDYKDRNNRSCVLKVSSRGGSLLLTGDIEREVEEKLLGGDVSLLAADVLVVPHHGSKTSSTVRFIEAVGPDFALFPAGYRNRYRLPNKDIITRYLKTGASLHSSGQSGAIRVLFDPMINRPVIDKYREAHQKYWNHVAPVLWFTEPGLES